MKHSIAFGYMIDVGRSAPDRVRQIRFGIHANVCLHAKVPLVALLR